MKNLNKVNIVGELIKFKDQGALGAAISRNNSGEFYLLFNDSFIRNNTKHDTVNYFIKVLMLKSDICSSYSQLYYILDFNYLNMYSSFSDLKKNVNATANVKEFIAYGR